MKSLQNTYNFLFGAGDNRCDRTVMNAIIQGNKTSLDIADATGLSLGNIYAALNRLERRGSIYSQWDEESAQHFDGNRDKYYYLR